MTFWRTAQCTELDHIASRSFAARGVPTSMDSNAKPSTCLEACAEMGGV